MGWIPLVFASGMATIDAFAFSIIKKVSEKALQPWFAFFATIGAMGLYALQPYILLRAMPFETVAVMNILWNLISSVVVTAVSLLVLGERVGGYKLVGVLLGIVSLFLCSVEEI